MAYRTLEELSVTVSARLGFGARGATLGGNSTLIRSFLQNAQYQLYQMQNWRKLKKRYDATIGVGQTLLDYPADANEERILKISTNRGTDTSPDWVDMVEGIDTAHYNTVQLQTYPRRYECYSQIETWPENDSVRKVRIWYIQALPRFTENGDRAVIDDEMLLLHATSAGKSHYRQPDAPSWASQLDALLARVRGSAFGNKRFQAPGKADYDTLPRPVVVNTP